jgi:hypothetical protein
MSITPLVRLGRLRSAQSIPRNVPRSRTSRSSWSALRVASLSGCDCCGCSIGSVSLRGQRGYDSGFRGEVGNSPKAAPRVRQALHLLSSPRPSPATNGKHLCDSTPRPRVPRSFLQRRSEVRKVVQIAVSSETGQTPWNLFALCDDGTIWRMIQRSARDVRTWESVEDIRQPSDD